MMPRSLRRGKFDGLSAKLIPCFLAALCCVLALEPISVAQENNLEFALDVKSETTFLPQIFSANIDLSGRGFSRESIWPPELAAAEVLDTWQKDMGFKGIFRLQYNLWEIEEFSKNKNLQKRLLANYEDILKKITDASGVAIVDIFGTPAGMGRILDKKSPPVDLKEFKALVKEQIRYLSCIKRYKIWYEIWRAPDLDDFFLGRKQDYLNLYRVTAEAIGELEREYKIQIPLGGPSTSWWFQNFNNNTALTPERSLIYELIKFCFHYRLPLDFISWHAYSTDPKTEKEKTRYNKTAVELIRAWLSYFHFTNDIPLVVDEWNYDSGANILPARYEKANIGASFIFSRLQQMQEAGLSQQVYYCLEDFQNNKENVNSNVGAFWFDPEVSAYKGYPKVIYNAFKMMARLGNRIFLQSKPLNDFVGLIATKDDSQNNIAVLVYNYIDPRIGLSYLSRNIASLGSSERKVLLDLMKTDRLTQVLEQKGAIAKLRTTGRVKGLLERASQLHSEAKYYSAISRPLRVSVKNLNPASTYLLQKYVIDDTCVFNCKFSPAQEKEINAAEIYQETLELKPYSVNLLIFSPKQEDKTVAKEESGKSAEVSLEAGTE